MNRSRPNRGPGRRAAAATIFSVTGTIRAGTATGQCTPLATQRRGA